MIVFVICRYPFNRILRVASRRTFLNPIGIFFQEWMVLCKAPIKRSTGHRSDIQENHWAYRHQPRVKVQCSHHGMNTVTPLTVRNASVLPFQLTEITRHTSGFSQNFYPSVPLLEERRLSFDLMTEGRHAQP